CFIFLSGFGSNLDPLLILRRFLPFLPTFGKVLSFLCLIVPHVIDDLSICDESYATWSFVMHHLHAKKFTCLQMPPLQGTLKACACHMKEMGCFPSWFEKLEDLSLLWRDCLLYFGNEMGCFPSWFGKLENLSLLWRDCLLYFGNEMKNNMFPLVAVGITLKLCASLTGPKVLVLPAKDNFMHIKLWSSKVSWEVMNFGRPNTKKKVCTSRILNPSHHVRDNPPTSLELFGDRICNRAMTWNNTWLTTAEAVFVFNKDL
ncbi:hypothetical protein DVH24_039039, partial [Malus domestica]